MVESLFCAFALYTLHYTKSWAGHMEKQEAEMKRTLEMETEMEIGNGNGNKNAPITGAMFSSWTLWSSVLSRVLL